MNRTLLATAIAVVAATGAMIAIARNQQTAAPATVTVASAKVGQPAPEFALPDTAGRMRSLSEFKGKTVVLEWTNHGCPFVKKHYGAGNMQRQQRTATGAGVVWLSVNSSAPGKQGHVDGAGAEKVRLAARAAQSAYLLDPSGRVGRLYGARTTPHMYVIDAEGVLRYAGGIDSIPSPNPGDIGKAVQHVEQALAELAAGDPVSMPNTRPYGCAVKYAG